MSPFYPNLPQPTPMGGLGALGQGFAQEQAIENMTLRQQQARMQMQQQQQYMDALKQSQQTGDTSALMAVAPDVALNIQKAQANQRQQAMDYAYMMADRMKADPAIIPQVKAKLAKMGMPDEVMSQDISPGDIDSFKANYEKMHGIKGGMVPMYDPTGAFKGMIPAESKIAPAAGMPTTIMSATGQPMGQVQGPIHVLPKETEKTPQWFENPENPKEGGWVTPGQQPPKGWVPRAQVMAMGKETQKQQSKEEVARMVASGEMAPGLVSKRGDYNDIMALAKKFNPSFSPNEADRQQKQAIRWATSLSSPQMARLETVGLSVVNTIDEIKTLSDQLKQSGITPLNRLSLEAKMKLAGNTPEGQLATRYVTAVNTLKEEFANVAQGGYAPTESVWNLANKQINENFGVDQMKASLNEIQRLINYRLDAARQMREQAVSGGAGGTSKPAVAGQGDYYNTFKSALSGPNRDKAIAKAQKEFPEYLQRARQEGLLQ